MEELLVGKTRATAEVQKVGMPCCAQGVTGVREQWTVTIDGRQHTFFIRENLRKKVTDQGEPFHRTHTKHGYVYVWEK